MVGKAGLITVIGFSIILGYLSLNIARLAKNSIGNMSSYNDATVSHNLATAGANIGLARFYSDTTWFGDTTQELSGDHFNGSIRYYMTDMGGGICRLRSISSYVSPTTPVAETLSDTVEVFFNKTKEQSFSMFAWMTQIEGGVNWITKDTVWGRIHSNDVLTINGSPVFMDKVTTSKNFNARPGRSPNYAIFKKSYETGVAKIDFPNDLSDLVTASQTGGKYYTDNLWVELKGGTSATGDGKVYVHKTSFTGAILDSISLNGFGTFNGTLVSTGTVNVKGTLDGQLTIGSTTDVVVQDDIVYENKNVSSTDDLLGLVANNDVIVADNTANNSNCEIDGCIFTRTGSFKAENYDSRPVSGTLNILGSIVQYRRGPVGTFNTGTVTIKTGFSKRYRYDSRLANVAIRPPHFPGYYVKTYAITNWWESYRVPHINQ